MAWAEEMGFDSYDGEDIEPDHTEEDQALLKKYEDHKDHYVTVRYWGNTQHFSLKDIIKLCKLVGDE